MKKPNKLALCCILAVILCCFGALLWIHRRVIAACIKGEPMPEPPAWHFWCRRKETAEE